MEQRAYGIRKAKSNISSKLKAQSSKEEPSAVGGALQSSLFELRPDKSLEVRGEIGREHGA